MDKLHVIYLGPKDQPGTQTQVQLPGTDSPSLNAKPKRKGGGHYPRGGVKLGSVFVDPEHKRNPVGIRLPQYLIDWMYTQDKSLTKVIEHAVTIARRRALTS